MIGSCPDLPASRNSVRVTRSRTTNVRMWRILSRIGIWRQREKMGSKSSIEWCDATWNPVRGCSMAKGSENGGCLNCYAARLNARNLPGMVSPTTGEPFARVLQFGPRWTGKVELIESTLTLPLKWCKPKRIFVNSLSDLFHEALPDEAIDRVFAVMALCPQHTFQVLTKRPERMLKYLNISPRQCDWNIALSSARYGKQFLPDQNEEFRFRVINPFVWPLPNVWLGVSVENQSTADMRIPFLLKTPAAIRFVSYEPALGPVGSARLFPSAHGMRNDKFWLMPENTRIKRGTRSRYCMTCNRLRHTDQWPIPKVKQERGSASDAATPC